MTTTNDRELDLTVIGDSVIFQVHLQPRASRTAICGTFDGRMKLQVTSPPVEDAANRLCIEFLAKQLGVAKSKVTIIAGAKSRQKTIKAEGVSREHVLSLLP